MTLSFAAIVFLAVTATGFNYCQVLDKSFSKGQQKVLVASGALILFSQLCEIKEEHVLAWKPLRAIPTALP